MQSLQSGTLPSMRRQHLQSEYVGLKQACPESIFVGLTPGNVALWSAVLFVRDGPYAPAVLRFHISFPDSYPQLPPVVIFSTDIFHPLITPLTTYMYTTDIQDNGTVSATDHERLPPGGFSLRHGFPDWFGRGRRGTTGSRRTSGQHAPATPAGDAATETPATVTKPLPSYMRTDLKHHSIYDVLKYIRSAFDDPEILDLVPLDAAGNPGAWHAWRTHRRKLGKLPPEDPQHAPQQQEVNPDAAAQTTPAAEGPKPRTASPKKSQAGAAISKRPGDWNWDGVWEDRVKKGVAASLSESALYGGASSAEDLIHFLPVEDQDVESIKENIQRSLDHAV